MIQADRIGKTMVEKDGIKGLFITIRSLGLMVALRETIRRLLGVECEIKGVKIRNYGSFKTIRDL